MDTEKEAQMAHNTHKKCVVIILNIKDSRGSKQSTGSGFIIWSTEDKCLILTCEHVISCSDPSSQTLYVRFPDRPRDYEAKVLYYHTEADLAVITVEHIKQAYPVLTFGISDYVLPGTTVFLLGYIFTRDAALCLEPAVCPGEISASPRNIEEYQSILYTCTAQDGFSGSPLIIGDKVIGVHFGSDSEIMFARAIETVDIVLKEWLNIEIDDTRGIDEMIGML